MRKKLIKTTITIVGILMAMGMSGVKAKSGDEIDMTSTVKQTVPSVEEMVQQGQIKKIKRVDQQKVVGNLDLVQLNRLRWRVSKAIDSAIKYLKIMKARTESNSDNGRGVKEKIRTIDMEISWLESQKKDLEKIKDVKQLRQMVKEIKQHWQRARVQAKLMFGEAALERFDEVLVRLENTGVKIKVIINDFKDKGIDVSRVEELYNNFEAQLEVVRTDYKAAKMEYDLAAKNGDEVKAKAVRTSLKQASQQMREAYQTLRLIIKELKTLQNRK